MLISRDLSSPFSSLLSCFSHLIKQSPLDFTTRFPLRCLRIHSSSLKLPKAMIILKILAVAACLQLCSVLFSEPEVNDEVFQIKIFQIQVYHQAHICLCSSLQSCSVVDVCCGYVDCSDKAQSPISTRSPIAWRQLPEIFSQPTHFLNQGRTWPLFFSTFAVTELPS